MRDRKLLRMMAETRTAISASRLVGAQADILLNAEFFPSAADCEALRRIRIQLAELEVIREEYRASAQWEDQSRQ